MQSCVISFFMFSKKQEIQGKRCVEFQEKISWRTIPDVLNSKKRSHDVPSQMCWIPRKDLMTYHPRCVEFQEKISWHNIPDVLKSKERYYTPPPPPTPHPPNQHHAKKTTKKDKKRGFTEAKHKKKGKNALSLWRQCSELAKTLFRDAAFCARPANYPKNSIH